MIDLIRQNLANFFNLDFGKIKYEDPKIALMLAGIISFLILIKLLMLVFGRRRHYSMYPGHFIYSRYGKSLLRKLFLTALNICLIVSVAGVLVALANPYLGGLSEERKIIKSVERLDYIDASISMGFPYENSGVSLAEFVRSHYLKFLNSRKNKQDRVAIWIFSGGAYLIEDFTTDSEFYILQASDAPYVLADPNHQHLPDLRLDPLNIYLDIIVPPHRLRLVNGEGGTNIIGAFQTGIKYFEEKGRKDIKERAILMITDMAASEYPEKELQELQKRRIKPYVIYIENKNYERMNNSGDIQQKKNAEKLKQSLASYGGKYFHVSDARSQDEAYAAIEELEKSEEEIVGTTYKTHIFQTILVIALLSAFGVIILGLISEIFGIYP